MIKHLLALLLIFSGEALAIWSELFICRAGFTRAALWPSIIGILGAGICLLPGYRFMYEYSKSIWSTSIISLSAIAILEPSLIWIMFKEMPTIRQMIGFLLGVVAIALVSL